MEDVSGERVRKNVMGRDTQKVPIVPERMGHFSVGNILGTGIWMSTAIFFISIYALYYSVCINMSRFFKEEKKF